MIQGFYTAATALKYRQYGIRVVADNVANVNTATFKKSTPVFKDALYSAYEKEYPDNQNILYQVGNGAYTDTITKDMRQGTLTQTGRELDIAVQGEGFLTAMDTSGNISYTRGGSFYFEMTPNGKRITDGSGNYIVDRNRNMLTVPAGTVNLNINETGTVIADGYAITGLSGVMFDNPEGLEKAGKGYYRVTENSGNPIGSNVKIKQGYLEMSNVDLISEMVELIKHQRIFQMNSKVISVTDEMDSMANKLRR